MAMSLNSCHWIQQCEQEMRELEQLLASSLGPVGCHKLVETGSKQVLCTSSGSDILRAVKPRHPVLAAAVKAAMVFGQERGDGTKRLLLMVLAGLRAAQPLLQAGHYTAAARLCLAMAATQPLQEATAAHTAEQLQCQIISARSKHRKQHLADSNGVASDHSGGQQPLHPADAAAAVVQATRGATSDGDVLITLQHGEARSSSEERPDSTCTSKVAAQHSALHSAYNSGPAQQAASRHAPPQMELLSPADDSGHAGPAEYGMAVCEGSATSEQGSMRQLKRMLRALITTQLCNRASVHVVRAVLAPLLTDLILAHAGSCSSLTHKPGPTHATSQQASSTRHAGDLSCVHRLGGDLWPVLASLAQSPPVYILPGQPVEASELKQGLLLDQGLASTLMPTQITSATVLMLACALVPAAQEQNQSGQVLVQSAAEYATAAAHGQQQLHRFLAHIKACGVNLVLCTHPCNPTSTHICLHHNIACAPLVEKQQVQQACALMGVLPITCLATALQLSKEQLCIHYVGRAPQARVTAVAGQPGGPAYNRGLILELENPAATHIQLAGPSDGLCREYKRMLADALLNLASACQPHPRLQQLQPKQLTRHGVPSTRAQMAAAMLARDSAVSSSPGLASNRQSLHSDALPCIPGGCAFDASMAKQLQQLLQQCRSGQVPPEAADVPLPLLLTALPVWHAMACVCPRAILVSAHKDGHQAGQSTALQLLEELLRPRHKPDMQAQHLGLVCPGAALKRQPAYITATLCNQQHMDATAPSKARASQGQHIPDGMHYKAMCSTDTCKLPSALHELNIQDKSHRSSLTEQDVLALASPAAHGVLEPKQQVLAIWMAASQLVLQLLRVDAVVASNKLYGASMKMASLASSISRQACHARRGQLHGGDSSEDEASDGACISD